MTKLLIKKPDLEERVQLQISLPFPFGLSHIENIRHCIQQLKSYSKKERKTDLVIGYYLETTAWGAREQLFRILSQREAEVMKEELRSRGRVFEYITLNELREYHKEIESGRYKINNGRITGPNYRL